MVSSDLLSELSFRLAVLISLTAAFGGLGFLFTVSFLNNSTSILPVEYSGRVLAVGIALVTLFICGLNIFGIPLTKSVISIAILSFCGICTLRLFQKKPKIRFSVSRSRTRNLTENLIPISLFFILFVWRVIQIKGVIVPNWYDGFIHTYLLEGFIHEAGIPFDNLNHIGFYAITFVVHFFWGLSIPETILLSGQWLSVVCGISLYLFARRFIHQPYASGLSLVVYSFILLFPSLLVSWGHYPSLLGFVLLPPAILTSQDWIISRKSSLLEPLLLIISLNLIHYGLLLAWFSFMLVFVMNQIMFKKEFRLKIWGNSKRIVFKPLSLLFPALIVILSNVFDSSKHEIVQNNTLSQFFITNFGFGTQHVLRLFRAHDTLFIVLWIIWVLYSLVWSRKFLYATFFWPLATWFLIWIQYQVLHDSLLTYGDVIVFLSLPIAVSIGLFARQMLNLLIKLDGADSLPISRHRMKSHLSILLCIAMIAGISTSPLTIDQKTILFTNEDLLAMKWITAHTEKDAGFLIRSVNWGTDSLLPSDGGGWIPFLTGRRAIIPKTGELYDICQFAADHNVNYLYFGQERGSDQFDLRLSDPEINTYVLVYGSPSVEIVSLHCK